MCMEAEISRTPQRGNASRFEMLRWLLCLGVIAVSLTRAHATQILTTGSALGFFTNAAAAMFRAENFRDNSNNLITVTNIPVYPVNFYTPVVHRLLQVAANIYECTTTNL